MAIASLHEGNSFELRVSKGKTSRLIHGVGF